MTINVQTEHVLTLSEAARVLPRRRQGRKAHVSTIYRWAKRGLQGVRLETIQVGGTLCTSREALQRFFDRLTKIDRVASPGLLSVAGKSDPKETDAELTRLGF